MKTPIILRIYRNGSLEATRQFDVDQIVIGRNTDTQVTLNGDDISPVHAVIEMRDTGYYIVDLGSASGTFRGGQKVLDESLRSGDELQIGSYKIEFFVGVPKPAQPPTPPPVQRQKAAPPPLPQATTVSEPRRATPGVAVVRDETARVDQSVKTDALAKTLKSSRGPVVEVVVAWGGVVIETRHFHTAGEVTIGSDDKATINLPLLGLNRSRMTLLKIDGHVKVRVTHEMTGDYYRDEEHLKLADLRRKNRVVQQGAEFELELAQGEMIRLGLMGDLLSIYIRYINETPIPLVGPLFDLTTSEATAVLASAVVAAIFGLYMFIYKPMALKNKKNLEQPLRLATIQFNIPVMPVPTHSHAEQKRLFKVPAHVKQTTTLQNPGRAAEIKRTRRVVRRKMVASSIVHRGGAVRTGHRAAGLQTKRAPNIKNLGLLGVFGTNGTQNQLSQAAAGAGELVGDANQKNGYTGSNNFRPGDLGGRLKNIGASGTGAATYGIAGGVGTVGKGTGTFGAGLGGLGKKGRVDLNIGNSEAQFTGNIDKDAIRRVIDANRDQFQFCYDQALRRNSDAYGKVVLHWEIVQHGQAVNVGVKSNSVGDREMGYCLARVVRGLTFPAPPPDTAADVIYPFVFTLQ